MCVYVSESSVTECIQDCAYVKSVFTLLSASYVVDIIVLRDNEIHVLLSRTAKRIHLKVIIPQENVRLRNVGLTSTRSTSDRLISESLIFLSKGF